jgi:hypothetical protein
MMPAANSAPEDVRNLDRPIPGANTGSWLRDHVANLLTKLIQIERRFDPLIRPAFDATLRDPVARLLTRIMNARRTDERLALAQEKPLPQEEEFVQSVIEAFQQQMTGLWRPGKFERGGNTKTHGIVRGELVVHEGLAQHLRQGVFAEPRTFPCWVRFAGPGPYITPDIDDVGFMSMSLKLMGVAGPKLMDEEKQTQDFLSVCTPTFVTPDIIANAALQRASLQNVQMFYFLNLHNTHLLDLIMQGLWTKTQGSPLEAPYFSCVPYLLGEGQAMQYSFWPTSGVRTPVPRLPRRPPDDYLRLALQQTLERQEVELEMRVQVQTDSFHMPIENAAILWPERLSPRMPVATLRLPRQTLDYPAALEFARRVSYNPWHCMPEHRPLGNQSRARKSMYAALSELRHKMNAEPHFEPSIEDWAGAER